MFFASRPTALKKNGTRLNNVANVEMLLRLMTTKVHHLRFGVGIIRMVS